MRNILTYFLSLFLSFSAIHAQDSRLDFRFYLEPGIASSATNYRVFKDSEISENRLKKSGDFALNAGMEILALAGNNWHIGTEICFNGKGLLAISDTYYQTGSMSGFNYKSEKLQYFDLGAFIEKRFVSDKHTIFLSTGFFYGFKGTPLIGFDIAKGNDFGHSLAAGIQKKWFIAKLDIRNGLVQVSNKLDKFRTQGIGVKLGYTFQYR